MFHKKIVKIAHKGASRVIYALIFMNFAYLCGEKYELDKNIQQKSQLNIAYTLYYNK